MEQVIRILVLSIGSVLASYLIKTFLVLRYVKKEVNFLRFSNFLKLAAMFFLEPISMFSSFWSFSFSDATIFALPLLGVFMIVLSAACAIGIIKLTNMAPYKAGSVFTTGVFSNILTFGGLTAFILFGVQGYSLILLINLMISPLTYFVGYPMSHQISLGAPLKRTFTSRSYTSKPYLAIPFVALILGTILNLSDITQPEFFSVLRSYLIPLSTSILGVSIGITLNFTKVRHYKREISLVFLIKFIISPLVVSLVAYLLGLHSIMDGLPFKVAIVASVMPVGFNALIPPALYAYDLDLANSAWITSTLAYGLILPIVYVLLCI